MLPGESIKKGLDELAADPHDSSTVKKVKQLIAELGTEGQELLRSVSGLISMPREMKRKEQKDTTLEAIMNAVQDIIASTKKGFVNLFRNKDKMAAVQVKLEKSVRELRRLRESIRNDQVVLNIESDNTNKQIHILEETIPFIISFQNTIGTMRERILDADYQDLCNLLERKKSDLTSLQLATRQIKGALELLIRNNELLLNNLDGILSVLPNISQTNLLLSKLHSRGSTGLRKYCERLKRAIKNLV